MASSIRDATSNASVRQRERCFSPASSMAIQKHLSNCCAKSTKRQLCLAHSLKCRDISGLALAAIREACAPVSNVSAQRSTSSLSASQLSYSAWEHTEVEEWRARHQSGRMRGLAGIFMLE